MKRNISEWLTIIAGSALLSAGFNLMLIPHQLLSGGISGVAMIVGYFTGWDISWLYLILNMPVMVWGWVTLGRRFILYSVVSVLSTVWLMKLIPVHSLTNDPIIAAVFGGVITGIGIGISLRIGGSSGGFDIIGSIITRKRDVPLGMMLFALNGFVIFALGYYNKTWDSALMSMLSIYISGKIVDMIHIRHVKITLFIITKEKDALLQAMLKLPRGVTLIKAQGAFSGKEHDMLMTVTTRYELPILQKIILDTDPGAFVNIVETAGVMGQFRRAQ